MDNDFQDFKKYKFNHSNDDSGKCAMTDTLGLSDDFTDFVVKTMRKEEIDCEDWPSMWENSLNKILPKNAVEAFYVGWVACKLYEQKQRENPFSELLEMFRK